MPTVFPADLDDFNNPVPTDSLNSAGIVHTDQHDDANDAIEAIEAKVGIDDSAVTTSLDYRVTQLEDDGVTGAGTAEQIALWSAVNQITGDPNFTAKVLDAFNFLVTIQGATIGATNGDDAALVFSTPVSDNDAANLNFNATSQAGQASFSVLVDDATASRGQFTGPGVFRFIIGGESDTILEIDDPDSGNILYGKFEDGLFVFREESGTAVLLLDLVKKNVLINTEALATDADDGFLYITSSAGPPTGTPTAYTGRFPIHIDSTNKELYLYTDAWYKVSPSGASGSFTTVDLKTVTVVNGLITSIV